MWDTRSGESQEVAIVGEYHPRFTKSESQVLLVSRLEEPCIRRRSNVYFTPSQALSDCVRNVLIQVKSKHGSRSRSFGPIAFQQTGAVCGTKGVDKGLIFPHLVQDVITMVMEVGQGRVNLAESEVRQALDDFLRRAAMNFCLGINVLDPNACPSNECPRMTVSVGLNLDVRRNGLNHDSTISLIASIANATFLLRRVVLPIAFGKTMENKKDMHCAPGNTAVGQTLDIHS